MIKRMITLIMIIFLCGTVFSGAVASGSETYKIKSSYLKNPDSIIAIADQSAKFWEKAYDTKYGGFYTYINRDGSVDTSRPYKVSSIQERNAYAFAKAYQLTGKKEYLDYARKALDFLYKYAWDKVNGGWYQEMNRDGSLVTKPIEYVDWNNMKWFGYQFGALTGSAAVYNATRDNTYGDWMTKTYDLLEKKIWDSRQGYEGYYENSSKDWSNVNTKSPFSTLDLISNPFTDVYLLNKDDKYKARILTLADVSVKYIIKSMDDRQFGFVDRFDDNWNPTKSQITTSSSNILKSGICLYRAYLLDPKPEYKTGAENLLNQILNSKAYDTVNGGPYSALDPQTGDPIDYKKSSAILDEGLIIGLTGFYVSKDPKYLKMADESLDFFMKYMYDKKYGDVFDVTDANGSNPTMDKGSYWKDAFHTLDLCYYTYVCGNLMLNNKPVTLYYYINPDKGERNISLNPIWLGENKLSITSVKLNGKEYKNFNGLKCLLKIPAKTGGEFKVTFKPVIAG